MKKSISITILLILAILLVSCSSKDNLDSSNMELETDEITQNNEEQELEDPKEIESTREIDNNDFESQEPMELSKEGLKEINIFLSNFTEVYLGDFSDELDNDSLINFAVRHTDINNFEAINIDGHTGYLDKSIVERNIKKYFGDDVHVEHSKTERYKFNGNSYEIIMADGDIAPMAIVSEMYDSEDGTYIVFFKEIRAYDVDVLDYSSSVEDVENALVKTPDEIDIISLKRAVVKRHNFEGKERYMLIKYETIERYMGGY